MKTVEKGVYELLKGLASGQVYALRAPSGVTGPFIVFQRVASIRLGEHLQGPAHLTDATIQVDVYANDFYTAKDIRAQAETILAGYIGPVYYGDGSPQEFVKISSVTVQGDSDLMDETADPLLYRNSTLYNIMYEH